MKHFLDHLFMSSKITKCPCVFRLFRYEWKCDWFHSLNRLLCSSTEILHKYYYCGLLNDSIYVARWVQRCLTTIYSLYCKFCVLGTVRTRYFGSWLSSCVLVIGSRHMAAVKYTDSSVSLQHWFPCCIISRRCVTQYVRYSLVIVDFDFNRLNVVLWRRTRLSQKEMVRS